MFKSAIKNLTKNKTTLVIAHRLSTIHNADKIFVIKKGSLIDSGKHEELIKNCDYYKLLYEKQLNKNYALLLQNFNFFFVSFFITVTFSRRFYNKEDKIGFKEKLTIDESFFQG